MADWLTGTGGIEWLQGFGSPPLDLAMRAITELGAWPVLALLALAAYWIDGRRDGLWIAWLLVSTMLATDLLKLAFAESRPPETYWIVGASGFGLPSGHASAAAAFWPAFLLRPARRWSAALAGVLIVLVAISRVYLGVHFPLDVLAGSLLGLSFFAGAWALRARLVPGGRRMLLLSIGGLLIAVLFILSVVIAPSGATPAFYPLGLGLGLLVGTRLGTLRPPSMRMTTQVQMLGWSVLLALLGFSAHTILPTGGPAETVAPLLASALALSVPSLLSRRPSRASIGPQAS